MNKTMIRTLALTCLPAVAAAFITVGQAPLAQAEMGLAPQAATADLDGGLSGAEAQPLAACQNVTLNVKNNKSVKIKALKVEYKSKEDGKWRSESFNNREIAAGATETVKSGASLEHVEGHTMESIKLHYKKWCGGKWSVTYTTTDSTFDSAKCIYGKTYRVDTSGGGC